VIKFFEGHLMLVIVNPLMQERKNKNKKSVMKNDEQKSRRCDTNIE